MFLYLLHTKLPLNLATPSLSTTILPPHLRIKKEVLSSTSNHNLLTFKH